MLVRNLMNRGVIAVGRGVTVHDAAIAMKSGGVRRVVVTDHGKPVGLITERDLVVRVLAAGLDPVSTPVEDVMSSPVVTVSEECMLSAAVLQLGDRKLRHLLVVNPLGRLTGILSLAEISDSLDRSDPVSAQVREQEHHVEAAHEHRFRPAYVRSGVSHEYLG